METSKEKRIVLTPSLQVGQLQNFITSLLSKTKQRKRRNIKEMTSANNFRALFGLARPKLPFNFNILFKSVAQHGIEGGLIGAILLYTVKELGHVI